MEIKSIEWTSLDDTDLPAADDSIEFPELFVTESVRMAHFYGVSEPKLSVRIEGGCGYDPEAGVYLGKLLLEDLATRAIRAFPGQVDTPSVHPLRIGKERKEVITEADPERLTAAIQLFVFAHEWAHHLQKRHYGWENLLRRTRLYEIQADILAGYWMARECALWNEDERERFFLSVFESGRVEERDSHGDPRTRLRAAKIGLSVGAASQLVATHSVPLDRKSLQQILTESLKKARELEEFMTSDEEIQAPCLTAKWQSTKRQALLVWNSTSRTDLARYEVKWCPGTTFDKHIAKIARVSSQTANSATTRDGLGNPGSVATFKVFLVTTLGAEKDSNPATVTVPSDLQHEPHRDQLDPS